MKHLILKVALAVPIIIASVAGFGATTAGATPVFGGSLAVSFPFWPNTHWVNMQVASAFGPSSLINDVYAGSASGCNGCTALAVSLQVDLVSYASVPPNESDVAKVVDRGSDDQNLAAAIMIVVTAPGQINMSASGRAQLAAVQSQLKALSLVGGSALTVQGEIGALLGQVIGILQSSVTDPLPGGTVSVATSTGSGVQITSNVQFAIS